MADSTNRADDASRGFWVRHGLVTATTPVPAAGAGGSESRVSQPSILLPGPTFPREGKG